MISPVRQLKLVDFNLGGGSKIAFNPALVFAVVNDAEKKRVLVYMGASGDDYFIVPGANYDDVVAELTGIPPALSPLPEVMLAPYTAPTRSAPEHSPPEFDSTEHAYNQRMARDARADEPI